MPLSFATPFENVDFEKTKNQFLLSSQTNVLEVNLQHEIDWIVFNVQQTGKCSADFAIESECTKNK